MSLTSEFFLLNLILSDLPTFYRPQRSWAKVMFLQASVILLTGGSVCLSACWDTPHQEQTPPLEQTASQEQTHPLGADTPQSKHPPGADPPGADTPRADTPPAADSGIRSTSGQYASYWNAFLLQVSVCPQGGWWGVGGGGMCGCSRWACVVAP